MKSENEPGQPATSPWSGLEPRDIRCEIYTFKEGVLSRVAHDLLLEAPCHRVELGAGGGEFGFKSAGVRVVCAMRGGRRAAGTLSARDRRQIDENTAKDVLEPHTWPEIVFRAPPLDPAAPRLHGELTLCGRTRPVSARLERRGDRLVATFEIDQRDFGVRPFSAMLGALRIQPIVKVVVSLPAPR